MNKAGKQKCIALGNPIKPSIINPNTASSVRIFEIREHCPIELLPPGIIFQWHNHIFHISNAPSYLSDKPETCTNCHIMTPQYATWSHSSHREQAHCNDCHVPHNNALNKYYFKAKDGLRHATIFTLRKEPQVIFIKYAGKEVVQDNCIRCHAALITDSKLLMKTDHIHTA